MFIYLILNNLLFVGPFACTHPFSLIHSLVCLLFVVCLLIQIPWFVCPLINLFVQCSLICSPGDSLVSLICLYFVHSVVGCFFAVHSEACPFVYICAVCSLVYLVASLVGLLVYEFTWGTVCLHIYIYISFYLQLLVRSLVWVVFLVRHLWCNFHPVYSFNNLFVHLFPQLFSLISSGYYLF